MTRQTQISIIASIVFHALILLILAGVKIYTEIGTEDNLLVTFVSDQKAKPLRRSLPVRPRISLKEAPQRHAPEQYAASPERRSSVDFYVSAPVEVFSAPESVGQDLFQDTGMKRPDVELSGHATGPIATSAPENPQPSGSQIQPRISGGYELLSEVPAAQEEPDMDIPGDALRDFATMVRKRIEGSKKYPLAAQSAGIEGRAGIKMTILKDGRLEKVEIHKSSGHKILDKAALQSVRDSAPFAPIPVKARRDKIEMSITLVFKIT